MDRSNIIIFIDVRSISLWRDFEPRARTNIEIHSNAKFWNQNILLKIRLLVAKYTGSLCYLRSCKLIHLSRALITIFHMCIICAWHRIRYVILKYQRQVLKVSKENLLSHAYIFIISVSFWSTQCRLKYYSFIVSALTRHWFLFLF